MARELGRPLTVDDVRGPAAEALAEVFELELEELPAEDGPGLWAQPVHAGWPTVTRRLAPRRRGWLRHGDARFPSLNGHAGPSG